VGIRKEIEIKKRSLTAIWKDPDDATSLNASSFESAEIVDRTPPKPRERHKAAMTKEPIKLRLDADVLAALRASGDGWQTRVNEMLRASLRLSGTLTTPSNHPRS
jgi:uncharacterized protein (DUF4415 family)